MKRFLVPAGILFGFVLAVGVMLLLLPGAEHVQRELFRTLLWVGNGVLALIVLLLLFIAPYILGWPFAAFTNRLLSRFESSKLWHLAFLFAFGVLMAVVWPFVVQWVVPEVRWVSQLFAMIAGSGSLIMVYEIPPFGWGLYAALAQGVIYFLEMSLGKDYE